MAREGTLTRRGGGILAKTDAIATVAVRKLSTARSFYEDKLGFEPGEKYEAGVVEYRSGNTKLMVYESEFAGTNKATAVTWVVSDVAEVVRELKSAGVAFERYDFPATKMEGDVHVMGDTRAAWFRDPDGNIHAVVS